MVVNNSWVLDLLIDNECSDIPYQKDILAYLAKYARNVVTRPV